MKTQVTKVCLVCGKEFKRKSNGQKYCSPECSGKVKKEYRKNYSKNYRKTHKKEISEYSKEYYKTHRDQLLKYGKEYYKAHNKKEIIIVCPVCGKEFKRKNNNQKYCSIECRKIAQKEYQKNYYKAHKTQSFMRELVCPVCGKEFSTNQVFRKYCSPECSKIANKKARDEYNRRYYYLRKEFGFTSLSELDGCPHDLDCFNCPEPDCIMDFEEV